MPTSVRHREISEHFLAHAEQQLESGDFLQASEKAWGAVAHCVKAIARERRWPNKSHSDVRNNAERLLARTSRPRANRRMFRLIERLHINFYEELLDPRDVRIGIAHAKSLIEVLNDVDSQMAR